MLHWFLGAGVEVRAFKSNDYPQYFLIHGNESIRINVGSFILYWADKDIWWDIILQDDKAYFILMENGRI